MKASRVVAAVFGTVIKVFVAVVVIVVIYQGVMFGYEYGYRVFAETPVTSGEGRSVMFTVTEDMIPESEDETGPIQPSRGNPVRDSDLRNPSLCLRGIFFSVGQIVQYRIYRLAFCTVSVTHSSLP